MGKTIPAKAKAALRAELGADTPEYRDDVPDGEWIKANRGPSPLLTLRVPADVLEGLTALAEASHVTVSAVARGFILDGLAAHQGADLRTALDRLERNVAEVKARALAP